MFIGNVIKRDTPEETPYRPSVSMSYPQIPHGLINTCEYYGIPVPHTVVNLLDAYVFGSYCLYDVHSNDTEEITEELSDNGYDDKYIKRFLAGREQAFDNLCKYLTIWYRTSGYELMLRTIPGILDWNLLSPDSVRPVLILHSSEG